MAYDRSKFDEAGKPIGSPNDPLIGIAPNQTTGKGGKGLKRKNSQQTSGNKNSAARPGASFARIEKTKRK